MLSAFYRYIDKFCSADQNTKIHILPCGNSFGIIDYTSEEISPHSFWIAEFCMLYFISFCWKHKIVLYSGNILTKKFFLIVVHACSIFSLIIGICSIDKIQRHHNILIRNISDFQTYILRFPCGYLVCFCLACFATKIYLNILHLGTCLLKYFTMNLCVHDTRRSYYRVSDTKSYCAYCKHIQFFHFFV